MTPVGFVVEVLFCNLSPYRPTWKLIFNLWVRVIWVPLQDPANRLTCSQGLAAEYLFHQRIREFQVSFCDAFTPILNLMSKPFWPRLFLLLMTNRVISRIILRGKNDHFNIPIGSLVDEFDDFRRSKRLICA